MRTGDQPGNERESGDDQDRPEETSEEEPYEQTSTVAESETDKRTVVTCDNLTKKYRSFLGRQETTAVDGLDLEIKEGEVFGLLGPNGSGKTTTMKLLLGLLHPTDGTAQVLNRAPDHVATKERIGFLPEESYLYDFLTGKETLEFYASLFGMSQTQQEEKVDSLLQSVGLWEDRNRKLSEYSKGMSRRIGFAQSIINDPEVIFLDEPTVGLDPIIARELKDHILELKEEGRTLVVSSHVLADVEDVCDRVAILHDGVKRKEGEVDELLKIKEQLQVIIDAAGNIKQAREEIRTLLKERGWTVKNFSHPGRTLEDLFLTTIQESS